MNESCQGVANHVHDEAFANRSSAAAAERGAMIAFLILAHQDPILVKRLVSRLKPHDVYIHLDKKTPLGDEWADIDAVFVEPRLPVYWAGFSQVEATLSLLSTALAQSVDYDKIVLLSGSDYPARPLSELVELFQENPDHNFIRYVRVDESEHLPSLIDHHYFRDGILPWRLSVLSPILRKAERLIRKALEILFWRVHHRRLTNWVPFHGSAYWAITADCARHMLEVGSGPGGRILRNYYKRCFASDEQFFHSIVGNSKFADLSDGEQPYVGRGTFHMANLHLVDQSLAKWYTVADLGAIRDSRRYFVRKVSTLHSAELLDALDDRHSSR